jgi:hypothetical protein
MIDFTSKTTRKVLAYFFSEDREEISGARAARLLGEEEGGLLPVLDELESEGVVASRTLRGQRVYCARADGIFYNHYLVMFRRAFNLEDELRAALCGLDGVQSCYLIGDCARPGGAVEVVAVGSHNRRRARAKVAGLEAKGYRRISLVNLTAGQLRRNRVYREMVLTEALQLA